MKYFHLTTSVIVNMDYYNSTKQSAKQDMDNAYHDHVLARKEALIELQKLQDKLQTTINIIRNNPEYFRTKDEEEYKTWFLVKN